MSSVAAEEEHIQQAVGALTDFTIQPARSQQGGVQGVWSVGGHDHLDSVQRIETVHLVQQLKTHKSRFIKALGGEKLSLLSSHTGSRTSAEQPAPGVQ